MTQTISANLLNSLHACVSLASDVQQHPEANEAFIQLKDQLSADHPQAAELLDVLWGEMLAARRSAKFWEQISQTERDLTEHLAASHFQLQQNYLRLMQEQ